LLTVPRTTQHPEAAWRLIDFLTEVENQVKLVSTGFAFRIPTRQSAVEDEWFQEHPEYIPFVEGLSYGYSPIILDIAREWSIVHNEVVQAELSRAFIGEVSPAEALRRMENSGNRLLNR
jgi:multiple sugar transport system substrate-binding protein